MCHILFEWSLRADRRLGLISSLFWQSYPVILIHLRLNWLILGVGMHKKYDARKLEDSSAKLLLLLLIRSFTFFIECILFLVNSGCEKTKSGSKSENVLLIIDHFSTTCTRIVALITLRATSGLIYVIVYAAHARYKCLCLNFFYLYGWRIDSTNLTCQHNFVINICDYEGHNPWHTCQMTL